MDTSRNDRLTLLAGTGQNIGGLAVYVVASLLANVLIYRAFGTAGGAALGLVTLATQLAFVMAAGARFGMDMAAVRRVAIEVGAGRPGRARPIMRRAVWIASAVSVAVAVAVFAAAGPLASAFAHQHQASATRAFRAAAIGLPFIALVQVYLGGTRGLKIMRHTLYVFWVGQPVSWIVLMVAAWSVSKTITATVAAYTLSWLVATTAAWLLWLRDTRRFTPMPVPADETGALIRYGAPRAPAALLSQALFWVDTFVLGYYVHDAREVGVYVAAVRVSQGLGLFLTAVSYMFSPFVADLHARGRRDELNDLYKSLTRWVVAGTIPILLVLAVAPVSALHVFGRTASGGAEALRIMLLGQTVNVAVGAAGFVLIMAGRTGWDLLIYIGSFALDVLVAVALVPHFGMVGAATAQATTLAVSNAVRLLLVWRFVRIQPFDRRYVRLLAPAAIGLVATAAIHAVLAGAAWPVDLLGTGIGGTVVYVVALWALALTAGERAVAMRTLSRIRVR